MSAAEREQMTPRYTDPRQEPIDSVAYSVRNPSPNALYGLPREVRFCKRCVISNQRPNSSVEYDHTRESAKATIAFDQDGVCDACRAAERKNRIDWDNRRTELMRLCDAFRSHNGSYDCVVPGSGGKDSFYAAWVLKHEFGMTPLTVTWAPNIYTEWGWRNFDKWIHAGFDNYLMTPNGRVKRLLTRLAVENLFHPFQPFIIGQKAYAPTMAVRMGIPLVFYGENEAEYGNPLAENNSARRDRRFFASSRPDDVFLGGTSFRDLEEYFGIGVADLRSYLPSDPSELDALGVQVHYLGYYLRWHPQSAYYFSVEHGGFEASPERTPGTYSKYNSIDDKIDDLHYLTTYVKFGIGRATYDAAQEVRSGDLTRDEAGALVRRYDGEYPERFLPELLAYLSLPAEEFPEVSRSFETPVIDREYFDALTNRFRSPHLWAFDNGAWTLRRRVFDAEV
jgi:N-acetyl sugar amidotransferase